MDSNLSRAIKLSFAAMESGVAAGVTIAARAPLLFGGAHESPKAAAEARRMVAEKMEAALEGMVAAQLAMGQLWLRVWLGQVSHPAAFANGLTDVAVAAARPAHRKVRANARRLVSGMGR